MNTPKPADSRLVELVRLAERVSAQLRLFYADPTDLDIQHKADQSPVTAADLAAHQMIEAALQQMMPEWPVLSEESADMSGRREWPTFWLVDPLDGTKEFINRTGEFTVNIALIEQGRVMLAVIAVPVQHEVYAVADGQVWHVDAQSVWHLLSAQPSTAVWRLAMSRRAKQPAYGAFLQRLKQRNQAYTTVEAGSAYKFCLMAAGEIDVYPRLHPTSEWDTAAGQALLEALGGGLFDLQGRPFAYNQRDSTLNGEFVAVRCMRDLPAVLDDLSEKTHS
jgi:3'(2'), 5'-bisphosphate nucleotidase